MMSQSKQRQNKCPDTYGGIMWQYGSSSKALDGWKDPLDGFHNLKLQSGPQKSEQNSIESQAYVQNSTGHIIFSIFYMLIVYKVMCTAAGSLKGWAE